MVTGVIYEVACKQVGGDTQLQATLLRGQVRRYTTASEIDSILKANRTLPRLPVDARNKLKAACFRYVQVHASLVTQLHPGVPLFNVTTKDHYVLHIGLVAEFINPAYGGVWRGEDMMRVVRRLMAATSFGKAQRSGMERYCRALGFDMAFPDES